MMVVKGIVSAIYTEAKKLSVILPEYDNMTTKPLDVYGEADIGSFKVNDFVAVIVFNNDFNDAMVLSSSASATPSKAKAIEIILYADGWELSADKSYYVEELTLSDTTEKSRIDLQPTAEQLISLINQGISMFVANENGEIKAYSIGDKPSEDMTIKAVITEVSYT